MAASFSSTAHTPEGWRALHDELHEDIDLETLLDIERRTVEKGQGTQEASPPAAEEKQARFRL